MGHVVRQARIFGSKLGLSSGTASHAIAEIGGFRGARWNGTPNSNSVQSLLSSGRGFAMGRPAQLVLWPVDASVDASLKCEERLELCKSGNFGAKNGVWYSGHNSPGCFSRSYSTSSSAPSSLFPTALQGASPGHGLGFRQPQTLIPIQRSSVRGDRGFAKTVLMPHMQKPMKLRVYMGSPGVIGEPWKPLPPPLPFLKRWFTKEGWKIRKQNIQGMLKTGFTLAKIRQKTKGYSQTKFYRDATDLYKEINNALAAGDRTALRQLVTDNVLTAMKKELKHRELAWARVHWELVGPLKSIRTLQGRLIGIDQKNMDTAFAQLTLRIVSTQRFAAYDKQGKLVAGDPEKELTVEDIWVFERQISHPELRWKLCGRLSV